MSRVVPEDSAVRKGHIPRLPVACGWVSSVMLAMSAAFLFSEVAQAAPSNGQAWTFHQPDGTAFQARVVGDEYFAYYETLDGNIVEQDTTSRFWYYARPKADGTLERTPQAVGDPKRKAALLDQEKRPWLEASARIAGERAEEMQAGKSGIQKAPASGVVRGVFLFANFSDTTTTFTSTDLSNLINTTGYNSNGASGSVRDFYYENSYGTMTLEIDVYTCTLPQTRAYYGQNTGGAGTDANARQMITDAIAAANGTVNFANYDADGDGRVDVFGVVHQGQGEENGGGTDAVWSHSGSLASPESVDGKTVQDYVTLPERYDASSLSTIGVYCHELGHHLFNLPDLYDLDGSSNGVGNWSVMGYGLWLGPNGAKPCHFDPWCKMVLGWLSPTTITTAQTGLALPNFDEHPTALLVPVDPYRDGEYFLVCNRYKRSTGVASTGFDAYLPGSGALVLHVDDYVINNRTEARKKVDVEEADGLGQLDSRANFGNSGDLYPNGASAFNSASTPNTHDNDGTSTGIVVDTFAGAGTTMMTCSVTPHSALSGTYLGYDAMGCGGMGTGIDGIDFGVVRFTTNSAGILKRVKTYFIYTGTTNYTVYVYSGWSGGAPSGLLTSQSGSNTGKGFKEITLSSPQAFAANTDFYVQVKYDTGYVFLMELPWTLDSQCAGRSWISDDGVVYTNLTPANGFPYDLNIRADLQLAPTADTVTPLTVSPTNSSAVEFSVHFSGNVLNFNDASDLVITETGTVTHTGASVTGGPQDYTVTVTGVTGDGNIALAVSTLSDVQDAAGTALAASVTSATVTIDITGPNAPNVSGTTPTTDTTPTWSWTSGGGGGTGNYRYQLDSEAGTWTPTTSTSYTPVTDLTAASHTLYVQEQDGVGNWSASGSFAITIDNTPPVITLLGSSPVQAVLDSTYTDAGAIALDDADGNITDRIVVNTSAVNTAALGSYMVTYDVTDSAGNAAAQLTRTVEVIPEPQLPLGAWPVAAALMLVALFTLRRPARAR